MSSHPDRPSGERRARQRSSSENHTTSLVQLILRDPGVAGDMLEDDIATGGNPEVVLGLLDAAEAIFRLRGVDASAKLTALRQRIKRHAR
jgi:hypothetical protein